MRISHLFRAALAALVALALAGPVAAASRQNHYGESLAESTTTSTTAQEKLALTFTPDDNSDYLLLWSAACANSSATGIVECDLVDDDNATKLHEQALDPESTDDYYAAGGIEKKSYGASPGSKTYRLKWFVNSGGGTAKIRDATLAAIKLDAADQYAESETLTSTSSTTPVDKTTLTFTPASQGDYLIIASAEWGQQTAAGFGRVQLDVDGTLSGVISMDGLSTSFVQPWATVVRVNLTAASHTIKIQYYTNGSGTVRARFARIAAIRLDTLDNNYYAAGTASTTTNTTPTDHTTLTFTPAAKQHLALASAYYESTTSTTVNVNGRVSDAGVARFTTFSDDNSSGGEEFLLWGVWRFNADASSRTVKVQYWHDPSGTVSMGSVGISVLDLGTANPSGPAIGAGVIIGQ